MRDNAFLITMNNNNCLAVNPEKVMIMDSDAQEIKISGNGCMWIDYDLVRVVMPSEGPMPRKIVLLFAKQSDDLQKAADAVVASLPKLFGGVKGAMPIHIMDGSWSCPYARWKRI